MNQRFETFTVLIAKINRNIRKIKNQEMADYDLRSVHISCLYYLYLSDALTATDLCEKCEEDKATISRALDYLEENGYLTERETSAKRYKSPLLLTEKGAETGRRITDKVARALEETGTGLSEAELAEFYRCLRIISDNLDNLANQP